MNFFFTIDITGRVMLKRHNDIVIPIIEDYTGTIIETPGDAVMASFASSVKAVQASIAIFRKTTNVGKKDGHLFMKFFLKF
jgi:class 3 adenylate cyclase